MNRGSWVVPAYVAGMLIGGFIQNHNTPQPWKDCAEDAVYAWHVTAEADFPDSVTWECIALDDFGRTR